MQKFQIQSRAREELLDITSTVQKVIHTNNWQDGVVLLFCQHTTCGLTINEGADPAVRQDLIRFFQEIAPQGHGWQHLEGNTDAHIRSSLLGVSLPVPVAGGRLCLGRWQSIYLYEGDGPRLRTLLLQFLPEGN